MFVVTLRLRAIPNIFLCICVPSIMLLICRLFLVLYSAGSRVKSVQVVSSELSMTWSKRGAVYVWLYVFAACLYMCVPVIVDCIGYECVLVFL